MKKQTPEEIWLGFDKDRLLTIISRKIDAYFRENKDVKINIIEVTVELRFQGNRYIHASIKRRKKPKHSRRKVKKQ